MVQGKQPQNRDCPTQIGTVGNYVIIYLVNMHLLSIPMYNNYIATNVMMMGLVLYALYARHSAHKPAGLSPPPPPQLGDSVSPQPLQKNSRHFFI